MLNIYLVGKISFIQLIYILTSENKATTNDKIMQIKFNDNRFAKLKLHPSVILSLEQVVQCSFSQTLGLKSAKHPRTTEMRLS